MSDLPPIVVTAAGAQPQAPGAILAQLLALVAAKVPGYTANLPASLIEDISSTEVAGISLADTAAVDLINSLTPYGANLFLLIQLGNVYGVKQGAGTNTSVFVVFAGTPGYIIQKNFVVSDGTHQFLIQDGGVVASSGFTQPLFAVATIPDAFAVPPNTVTSFGTSVPGTVTLSVTNPLAGIPATGTESEETYRSRVLQAGRAASQGMQSYLKSLVQAVPGVVARLVSVIQGVGGWEVIVGGGDPYEVAYAIWYALFDTNNLAGSTLEVTNITQANPGQVTTNLNHGYVTGQVAQMNGVTGMTAVNGINYTITVVDEKNFTIGTDTTSFGAYTGGGVVTPNLRNETASITNYPDTYPIKYVIPPQQTVAIDLLWNTTATNLVSADAIAQLGAPALAAYVNSLTVGLPINLYELQETFQLAVAAILPPQLLTRMVFAVSINGIPTAPSAGTGVIAGDPESYFQTSTTSIAITQG
jgi:hypothetical protein